MNYQEIIEKKNEHRNALQKLNEELGSLKFKENELMIGKYYRYDDTNTIVYISVIGVDTADNLNCHMIILNSRDNTYNLTANGFIAREYAQNEITQSEFNRIKSQVAAYTNTML